MQYFEWFASTWMTRILNLTHHGLWGTSRFVGVKYCTFCLILPKNLQSFRKCILKLLRKHITDKNKRASYLSYVQRLCTRVLLHHKKLVPHPSSLNSFQGRGSVVLFPPSWGWTTSPWGLTIPQTAQAKKPQCCQQCPNSCSPRRSHFEN